MLNPSPQTCVHGNPKNRMASTTPPIQAPPMPCTLRQVSRLPGPSPNFGTNTRHHTVPRGHQRYTPVMMRMIIQLAMISTTSEPRSPASKVP